MQRSPKTKFDHNKFLSRLTTKQFELDKMHTRAVDPKHRQLYGFLAAYNRFLMESLNASIFLVGTNTIAGNPTLQQNINLESALSEANGEGESK